MQDERSRVLNGLYLSTEWLIVLNHKEDELDLGTQQKDTEVPSPSSFWLIYIRRMDIEKYHLDNYPKDISKCHRFLLLCHWLVMCLSEWFGPFLGKEEKWK